MKKSLKITLILIGALLLLIAVVPLLIPIDAADGLSEPEEMVTEGSAIATIPFDGTDGIELYYEYAENEDYDRTFILIHGSMYNSSTWSEVIDYFATMGNVYAYDQIPYGYSEKLVEGDWSGENPYTTAAAVEQLKLFMDELGIERATLVGSSFGGVLAAEMAIQYEDNVDSVILVDAAIFTAEEMPRWLLELPQAEHLGVLFSEFLSEGDFFYESCYYDTSVLTEDRLSELKRATELNHWNVALWEYLQAWSSEASTVSKQLDKITQHVLVISGAEDAVVPVEDSETIARSISNATLKIIEDCGHLPHEECPDEFVAIVDEWLANESREQNPLQQ